MTTQVTMGGERVPARELLKEAFASTKRPLQYDLGFDPDVPVYVLSPSLVVRSAGVGAASARYIAMNFVPSDVFVKVQLNP
jgi:hypothetical protein